MPATDLGLSVDHASLNRVARLVRLGHWSLVLLSAAAMAPGCAALSPASARTTKSTSPAAAVAQKAPAANQSKTASRASSSATQTKSIDVGPKLTRAQHKEWKAAREAAAAQNWPEVERRLRPLAEKLPEQSTVQHEFGMALMRQGRFDAARVPLERATLLRPDHAGYLTDLGYVQLKLRDYPASEVTCRRGLALSPGDRRLVDNLAYAVGGQERYEEASDLFAQVYQPAETLERVGHLREQAGDLAGALNDYRRAIWLDSDRSFAAASGRKLASQLEATTASAVADARSRVGGWPLADLPPDAIAHPIVTRETPGDNDTVTSAIDSTVTMLEPTPGFLLPLTDPVVGSTAAATAHSTTEDLATAPIRATSPTRNSSAVMLWDDHHPASELDAELSSPRRLGPASSPSPTADQPTPSTPKLHSAPQPAPSKSRSTAPSLARRDSLLRDVAVRAASLQTEVGQSAAEALDEFTHPDLLPAEFVTDGLEPAAAQSAASQPSTVAENDDPFEMPAAHSHDSSAIQLAGYSGESVADAKDVGIQPAAATNASTSDRSWQPVPAPEGATNAAPPVPANVRPLGHYCPVMLRETKRLILGRDEFKDHWQGQELWFTSGEALRKFQANPQAFLPVHDGIDVVVRTETGKREPGHVTHSAWLRNQLFLFVSDESLKKFQQEPSRYLPPVANQR